MVDGLHTEAFSTKHIGHLGLVADKIDDLDLVQLIDQPLPVSTAPMFRMGIVWQR